MMKKYIKITGAAMLLAASLTLCYPGVSIAGGYDETNESVTAPSEQEIYARGAVLMDAASGRVLYAKNGSEKMANASTTKIMTCILILEQRIPGDEMVEVSPYAASQPKVHLGMLGGEYYRVEDLLYSMMLESHNDSAVALAEHMGKNYLAEREDITSQEAVLLFVDAMNRKAREIGCTDTSFVTPNGLDAVRVHETENGTEETEHGTTAEDLARIMAYCVTKSPMKEQFTEITRTGQHSFSEGNGKRRFACINHNAFLQMMDGAVSGKTGFTAKAGYCYVAALEREGKWYTVALLACGWPNNKTYKWKDAKKLFAYGADAYEKHTLRECGDKPRVRKIPVAGGQGTGIGEPVCTDAVVDTEEWEGLTQTILLKNGQSLSMKIRAPEYLAAPVKSGMQVGEVQIFAGDELWQSCPLFAARDVKEIDQQWCARQVLYRFLLF